MSHQLIASILHPWVQSFVTTWSGGWLVAVGTGAVAMGLLDFLGDDEPDSPAEDESDEMVEGGDVMFDEGSGDDLGDLGGMDGGLDDSMDEGMGEFDEMGGGGDGGSQLESRVSDIENELSDVSSTMSTVRGENEQIAETVEEVEENVRKLLEIYEMVTRGVNPFVDDVQGGADGLDSGSFDVFGDGEGANGDEEIDDSISEADAESFFDEELVDEETEDDENPMADAPFPGEGEDGQIDEPSDLDDGDGETEKSFEELKEEYDVDEEDWSDPEVEGDETSQSETDSDAAEEELEMDESQSGEEGAESDGTVAAADGDGSTGGFNFGERSVTPESANGKPYLTSLPEGYMTDLVVVEWLDYLLEESSRPEAFQALGYYRDIDWIGPSASQGLQTVLAQLEAPEAGPVEEPTGALTMDHHLTSLGYIMQLANGNRMVTVPASGPERGEIADGV